MKKIVTTSWKLKKRKPSASFVHFLKCDLQKQREREILFIKVNVSDPDLEKILQRERKTPWGIVFILFGILFLLLLQSLLIGSKNGIHLSFSILNFCCDGVVPSIIGIRRCSALYWLGFAISLPIFIVIAIFISRYLVHNCEMKIQLGYSFEVCHDCTITELNRKRQTSISYFIATNSTLM
jgi:hypothetical protein